MSTQSYQLKHPVEVKNAKTGEVVETITSLTLVRPKGKHLRAMDSGKGPMGQTLALIGAIANLPPSTVDQLDGEDVTALGEIIADFFGVPLPTGEPSSQT